MLRLFQFPSTAPMKQFKATISKHIPSRNHPSLSSKTTQKEHSATPLPTISTDKMSTTPLSGKVALITGGTKGIGAATATYLVSLGAKVIVNYGRDTAAAETLVSKLGAENAYAVQADAGTVHGVTKLVQASVERFGKI